jgi:hypothetical protein
MKDDIFKKKHESSELTFSTVESINARKGIFEMMNAYQATEEEKERSLGLFLRGSLLARILGIDEIYKKIVNIPGAIFDIGTWRGQTAVVCENLRAIYEPLHFNRRIVCFDTFEGYKGFSDKDRATRLHNEGTYSLNSTAYAQWLSEVLVMHEKSNAMGHINGKHKVIAGDCRKTIPQYFMDYPGEIISLAFFDVNAFEPTEESFEHVWSRMCPGGITAFWQLTRDSVPAEVMVYAEKILSTKGHKVFRTGSYPGLCYLVKE